MAGKDIFAVLLCNIGIFKRPDDKLLNRHVICLDTARSEGLLFAQLLDHSEHEQLKSRSKICGKTIFVVKRKQELQYHIVSGSCHLDRASNVEIGVEC